jgi:hypothetical protein
VLAAGITPIKAVHISELRAALAPVYTAMGQPAPTYTDATIVVGVTPMRTVHITELRERVLSAP